MISLKRFKTIAIILVGVFIGIFLCYLSVMSRLLPSDFSVYESVVSDGELSGEKLLLVECLDKSIVGFYEYDKKDCHIDFADKYNEAIKKIISVKYLKGKLKEVRVWNHDSGNGKVMTLRSGKRLGVFDDYSLGTYHTKANYECYDLNFDGEYDAKLVFPKSSKDFGEYYIKTNPQKWDKVDDIKSGFVIARKKDGNTEVFYKFVKGVWQEVDGETLESGELKKR